MAKMREAGETLIARLDRNDKQLRRNSSWKNHPDCVVRGDGISFGCAWVDLKALRKHPDFRAGPDTWVRRQYPAAVLPYGRAAWFESKRTGSKFCVNYQRHLPHLPKFWVRFYPDDETGLQLEEVSKVLELTAKPRIARMEVAVDFGLGSGVDAAYVRRCFVSGKSRARLVRKQHWDSWGSRHSAKFCRSYFKKQIGGHRVELQLNRRFLRQHGIDDVFQFYKLVRLLPIRHFLFAEIDEQKLVERLRAMHFRGPRILEVLKQVAKRDWHLCATLIYLRRVVGIKNVRRLLVPLPTNQLAQTALREWARLWPKTVTPAAGRNAVAGKI